MIDFQIPFEGRRRVGLNMLSNTGSNFVGILVGHQSAGKFRPGLGRNNRFTTLALVATRPTLRLRRLLLQRVDTHLRRQLSARW